MNYIKKINTILKPINGLNYKVLDLFAGCGGLSMGFEALGFKTVGYEMDRKAVETYNKNLLGTCIEQKLTTDSVFETYDYDIVIGGPTLPTIQRWWTSKRT